jgi:DNA-binding CsgD family transcriptional regulator
MSPRMGRIEKRIRSLSSKEIANRMNISSNTVKVFLRLIMIKTGVCSRSAIVEKVMMTHPE